MSEIKSIQITRLKWIKNYLDGIDPLSHESERIVDWICSNAGYIGVGIPKDFPVSERKPRTQHERREYEEHGIEVEDSFWKQKIVARRRERYDRIQDLVEKARREAKGKKLHISPFEKNLTLLKNAIKLDDTDYQLILLLSSFEEGHSLYRLFEGRSRYDGDPDKAGYDYYDRIALMMGMRRQAVIEKFRDNSILLRAGFVRRNLKADRGDGYGSNRLDNLFENVRGTDTFLINRAFIMALREDAGTVDKLLERMIGPQPKSELTLADFKYVGSSLQGFVKTIRGALLDKKEKGKAFGIYGPPGVGKTELLAVIAAAVGAPVHLTGQSAAGTRLEDAVGKKEDPFGRPETAEPSRNNRIESFILAQHMAKVMGRRVILAIDEAEDLFNENIIHGDKEASKAFTNSFLDNIEVPTIIITNHVGLFEETTVRRMLPAIPIMTAPEEVRLAIMVDECRKAGVKISYEEAREIQEQFPSLTPGILKKITRTIKWRNDLKGRPAQLREALIENFRLAGRAMNSGIEPVHYTEKRAADFDYDLVNTTVDLKEFARTVSRSTKPANMKYCFVGPPGVGKRQFAYHLAKKTGRRILRYPYNLIESGGVFNDKECFRIFEEAKTEKAVLLLEGADALLGADDDEGHGTYLRMRKHPYPVIAVANNMNGVSQAAFTEFEQIIRFDYLDNYQRLVAFKKIFGFNPPPEVQAIPNLTYGQLVALKTKLSQQYNGKRPDDETIMKLFYTFLGNPFRDKPPGYKPPTPLSLDDGPVRSAAKSLGNRAKTSGGTPANKDATGRGSRRPAGQAKTNGGRPAAKP